MNRLLLTGNSVIMKKARFSTSSTSSTSSTLLKPIATRVANELNIGGAAKVWAEITELGNNNNNNNK